MKKTLYTLVAFLAMNFSYAQDEMAPVWTAKLEHKVDLAVGMSDNLALSYGASEKSITVVDNASGSVKWTSEFKTIIPAFKKVDEIIPLWDAKTMFLFDRKMGKDQMACVDINTGKLLWNTDKYQNITDENVVYISELEAFALSLKESLVMIKARTGEEIWQTTKFKGVVGAYMHMNDGSLIMLNYKPTSLGALFAGFKNQLTKVNTKNGDVIWDQTYTGAVQKKVFTKEPLVKLQLKEDKIFLIMNGIQVYDFKTGAKIWSAAYDLNLDDVVRAPAGTVKWGVYNAVADPVVVGNEVYVIDMAGKSSQYVKKYDLNTGKLIWTSPELKGVRVAPGLYVQGDKVVLQIGGIVETQAYIVEKIKNTDGSISYRKYFEVDNPNVKPYGLECFDANTGKNVWRSERFKKGVTNAFVGDEKVYVCSGKAIYSLALADGKENYEVLLADDNIGLAERIIDYKDKIVIVGEKGVSSHKKADGSLVANSKYKRATFRDLSENTILLQTKMSDIACFDMESCKYKKFDARKDANAMVSEDGKFVYVFEKKTILKLATR